MAKRSIAGEYFRGLLKAALLSGCAAGLLWVLQLHLIFSAQTDFIKTQEETAARQQAQSRTEEVYQSLGLDEQGLERRIENLVKTRVDEGVDLAQSIIQNNRGKSVREVQRLVADTLRQHRFFDGRGYYFIDTLEGEAVLYPHRPELEGTSILDTTDARGQRTVQQEIAIVREQGEGFVAGYWPRPQDPDGVGRLKISYVRRLEPFDWYIGAGDYYEDVRQALRQEIIQRYREQPLGGDSRIFILDGRGNELVPRYADGALGPTGASELIRTEEARLTVLKEEMAYAAANPGGYSYVREYAAASGQTRRTAVSIRPLPKWDMVIGAEVSADGAADGGWSLARTGREALSAMLQAVAVVAALYVFFIVALRRQTLKLRNDFIAFMAFFKRAAVENVMIDAANLQMQEFVSMAHLANQMVARRQEASQALQAANEQLEQQVSARTQALEESLQALENTQEQLIRSEKLSVLGNVVAGITHEINVPVGIARSLNSDLKELIGSVQEGLKAGEDRIGRVELQVLLTRMAEDAAMMEANLNRTAELVQSFKEVSVDQCSGLPRQFDLGEYLKEILLSLSARLRKDNHHAEVICEEGILVSSYPGVLSQIVINLVMNSLQHGFRNRVGGHITLEVIEGAGRILLLYRDDGCGIPARDIGRIYEPFFTTGGSRGGTGLGLHIVHQLVTERLSGTINLTSTEGRGVLFEIEFPRNFGE